MNLRFTIGVWGLLILSFEICFAQEKGKSLRLEDAIKMGLENSKLLKASLEKIHIAEAKISENNTQSNPRINVAGSYTRISDNVTPFKVQFPNAPVATLLNPQILNQYSTSASVSQLLYGGGRVRKTAESLDFLLKASKLDYQNDRSGAVFNIISAFYSLYKLEKAAQIIHQNEILLDYRINDLSNQEKSGIVLHNDVLKLEIQKSQLEIQAIDNKNAYETTRFGFNILIGLNDSDRYSIDTLGLFHYNLDKPYIEYENQTFENRSDILATHSRVLASKASIQASKANYLPNLSASGTLVDLRPNPRWFPNRDQFDATWTAGLTLSWDLSSLYNNKHYVNEAKYTYSQNKQLEGSQRDNIRIELYTNYLAWLRSKAHLNLSLQTQKQAEENYRIVNDRLQDRLVLPSDLQDATTSLIQSQLNVLSDKADLDISYYRFLNSTGGLKY